MKHNKLSLSVHTSNIGGYLNAISSIPLLQEDEELSLARNLQNNGDIESARKLAYHSLRFVANISRNYEGYGLPLADIIQEGNVGLMKAIKRFDPEQGVRLVSFAVHWIKAEIHEYVLKNVSLLRIATTKTQRKLFFNLRKLRKNSDSPLTLPDAEHIANKLDVTTKDVFEMEAKFDLKYNYLDTTDYFDEDAPRAATQIYNQSDDVELTIINEDSEKFDNNNLNTALEALDDRSKTVIKSRWLSEEKALLQDLAAQFKVSAERIRQIEKNALKKLKESLGSASFA
jgi:RNA polymerase sigma-32 factor